MLASMDIDGDDGDDTTVADFEVAPGDHLGYADGAPIIATMTVPKRSGLPKREKPPAATDQQAANPPIAAEDPPQAAAAG